MIAYHENDGKTETVPTGAMPDAVASRRGSKQDLRCELCGGFRDGHRRCDDEAGSDRGGRTSSAGTRGRRQAAPHFRRKHAQQRRDRDRWIDQSRAWHRSLAERIHMLLRSIRRAATPMLRTTVRTRSRNWICRRFTDRRFARTFLQLHPQTRLGQAPRNQKDRDGEGNGADDARPSRVPMPEQSTQNPVSPARK